MTTSVAQILLKGGTLLLHGDDDAVTPMRADLLVVGATIAQIGPDLAPAGAVEVIDCTDKLVSPGFVDAHRHLWQTQLKGRHADDSLLDYFPRGNFTNSAYHPDDVFWGQLGGALESIDAGTTTIVDHSHANNTPEHAREAVRASVASGIRSQWAFDPSWRVAAWQGPDGFKIANTVPVTAGDEWTMDLFDELARAQPFSPDRRVTLAFAFDGFFWPPDVATATLERARAAGVSLITGHGVGGPMAGNPPSGYKILDGLGLLGSDVLLSHANYVDGDDVALMQKTGASLVSTPATELNMSMGMPAAFRPDVAPHASLGVDCHALGGSSMPAQMRLGLGAVRGARIAELDARGQWAKHLDPRVTAQLAYNLGTVGGARAARLGGQVGRLATGYKADLVVFDTFTPAMLAAAQHDPVGAIVHNSTPADIDTVLVDGVVRKRHERLTDVAVGTGVLGDARAPAVLNWRDVAARVLASRARLELAQAGTDWRACQAGVVAAFELDTAAAVEY